MKKRIKRYFYILVSSIYAALWLIKYLVYHFLNLQIKPRYTAIYYHGVPSEYIEKFKKQLLYLKKYTTPINPQKSDAKNGAIFYTILTFDDALISFYNNAVPSLIEKEIPSIVFVPTNYIGKSNSWGHNLKIKEEKIMDEEQITGLPGNLFIIGSHTENHRNLTKINESELAGELERSKNKLEKILNSNVDFFSFPYGAYNETAKSLALKTGYKKLFITDSINFDYLTSESIISRTAVFPSDIKYEYVLKILGFYNWIPYIFKLKRRLMFL